MNIGLYFGSFNPVHHGHLLIANFILNEGLVDKVWFVVSPKNPHKESRSLLNENHRYYLVNLAIDNDERMKVSDVEFTLPRPSYTAVTLAHLTEKYPKHTFSVIMGSDSFQNIQGWKNNEYILKNFSILIYNRPKFEIKDDLGAKITIVDAPLLDLSATEIRSLIRQGKSIKYMLPDAVIEEIEIGGYYRK